MVEALLQDATDALLAQQAEIERLHRILAWCRTCAAAGEARQTDAMICNALPRVGGAYRVRSFASPPVQTDILDQRPWIGRRSKREPAFSGATLKRGERGQRRVHVLTISGIALRRAKGDEAEACFPVLIKHAREHARIHRADVREQHVWDVAAVHGPGKAPPVIDPRLHRIEVRAFEAVEGGFVAGRPASRVSVVPLIIPVSHRHCRDPVAARREEAAHIPTFGGIIALCKEWIAEPPPGLAARKPAEQRLIADDVAMIVGSGEVVEAFVRPCVIAQQITRAPPGSENRFTVRLGLDVGAVRKAIDCGPAVFSAASIC